MNSEEQAIVNTNDEITAIVGATGFVGSAVVRQATTPSIRLISRAPGTDDPRSVAADITDLGTIRSALHGCVSVIHCASYIGPSLELNAEVNERGTANVLQAAREHGIRRVTYVSTTGVYGPGPHRGTSEGAPTNPSSPSSISRLVAENLILESGGNVLRPHLLYGPGDTRVIPTLIRALSVMGGLPRGGTNMMSILDVRQFAQQLWELHEQAPLGPLGSRRNTTGGAPVSLSDVQAEIYRKLRCHPCRRTVALDTAQTQLRSAGFSEHQVMMATSHQWFTQNEPLRSQSTSAVTFELDQLCVAWYSSRQAQISL